MVKANQLLSQYNLPTSEAVKNALNAHTTTTTTGLAENVLNQNSLK